MTEQIEATSIRRRLERYRTHEHDPLGDYLDEISKTPLLRAEEEVELAQMIEAGVYAEHLLDTTNQTDAADTEPYKQEELEWITAEGQRAQEKFYLANTRLVVSIARRYSKKVTAGHDLLDMIQDGNVGLSRAIQDFSFTEGNKFSTYATWWIRREVSKGVIEKSRRMRLPRLVHDDVEEVYKSEKAMTEVLQREPLIADIAADTGKSIQDIAYIKSLGAHEISLNQNVGTDDLHFELGETIPQPEQRLDMDRAEKIREGIRQALHSTLSPRDAHMVELRHGLDGREWREDELAEYFGMTPNGVLTCLRRALAKVRNQNPELLDM